MRLYYGGYGHNPSGKQYVYWGSDNYRTGQNVVAPVTNPKSGKTYRTMFTIMRTSGADSQMAQSEAERLQNKGIAIKSIEGRDVLSLPSGSEYETKKQWAEESRANFLERARTRILGSQATNDSTMARTRLLEA